MLNGSTAVRGGVSLGDLTALQQHRPARHSSLAVARVLTHHDAM